MAILGVPLDDLSTDEAVERIMWMMLSGRPHQIATANVDFLVQAQQDPELHRILLDADMVVCDGAPVLWASKALGNPLPERVAGADLVPRLLREMAARGLRVFVLGAAEASAAAAVERLRREYRGLIVTGYCSPPFAPLPDMDHQMIAARVREARPDLLLVAFGCPKQEKWIAMHGRELGVTVSIGIGATIDFLSGHMQRAPIWMQRSGFEWLFRLVQEPRRLFLRYARDFRDFGYGFLTQYWRLGRRTVPVRSARSTALTETRDGARFVNWPARLDKTSAQDAMAWAASNPSGHDVVLNLAGVEAVDSTGLGFLLHLRRQCRARGCELVLLAPSLVLVRALRAMKLQSYFSCAANLQVAKQLLANRRAEGAAPGGSHPA